MREYPVAVGQSSSCLMSIPDESQFLTGFLENLRPRPACLLEPPECAVWLDDRRRVNTCLVRYYLVETPLLRVAINWGLERPLALPVERMEWTQVNPAKPNWRFELICLPSELPAFAPWIAAVVNRREGLIRRLPPAPVALLNWDDKFQLDDYVFYLSSIFIRTESSLVEDIKWLRRQAPMRVA